MQAPPNLVDLAECRALLEAGVDDWGGVSPLTPDHVNPERPWPSVERLRSITAECGFELRPRLTVHPEYVTHGEPWLDPRVSGHVAALALHDGQAPASRAPAYARSGCRGRSRTAASPASGRGIGRTDLHAAIDTNGRTDDRRSDFDEVYGDWDALREQIVRRRKARRNRRSKVPIVGGLSALAQAGEGPGRDSPTSRRWR